MIDILSLIYSYTKLTDDIYSLMSVNTEFYSLSTKWRKDNWSLHGIQLAPYQVNIRDSNYKKGKINFPDNHHISVLCLCAKAPSIILVNNKNMKTWIKFIKDIGGGFYDDDPAKSKVLINHISIGSHYRCSDKLEVFERTRLIISTPSALSSINNIEDKAYKLIYDYDANIVPLKYQPRNKVIQLTSFNDADHKYVKRNEVFIPDVNIIYTEFDQTIENAIKLFKEKRSLYIATYDRKIGIKSTRLLSPHAFYDDEFDNIYVDNSFDNRKYLPCDNIIVYMANSSNILRLVEKFYPVKRNIEVIIIPKIDDIVNKLVNEYGITSEFFYSETKVKLTYKLCRVFGYNIETLNKYEFTLLFGNRKCFNLTKWHEQPDNKFTIDQVLMLTNI